MDDGSGEHYRDIFQAASDAGCTVLTHPTNLGKGRALKTGFQYIQETGAKDGVVCADSDGQHLPEDIRKIAGSVNDHRNHIILGSRRFTGKVPLRSRFGNFVTRLVYALSTGTAIQDTQTGLRGYSADLLDWLCRVPGERFEFEYEMNMLLEARAEGYAFHEVPIDTVYLNDNESSHFRPVADSARIYFPILKFCTSSGMSAILDFLLLMAIQFLTSSLLFAVVGARISSSIVNYAINRNYVFAKGTGVAVKKSLPKYFTLVLVLLACNYGLMHVFYERLGMPIIAAKLLTESILFVFSYWSQRRFVYKI